MNLCPSLNNHVFSNKFLKKYFDVLLVSYKTSLKKLNKNSDQILLTYIETNEEIQMNVLI